MRWDGSGRKELLLLWSLLLLLLLLPERGEGHGGRGRGRNSVVIIEGEGCHGVRELPVEAGGRGPAVVGGAVLIAGVYFPEGCTRWERGEAAQ